MISAVCILSLLLQSVISNIVPIHLPFLVPLFSVSALIIVFPYFKDKNKFLITSFFFGLAYDILFSNYLFLNSFLFLITGIVIMVLNRQWSNNILNILLFQVITIIVYQVFSYFLISIIDKVNWNSAVCFKLVGNSLPMNLLYVALLYYITDKISKKYKIDKID